jgi:SPP1 gp7 family putative phage head morphogenesis protein
MTIPIRKDPAGFKSTELRNARILVGLVTDFEELVLLMFERKGRALATPLTHKLIELTLGVSTPAFKDIDFKSFYKNIEVIEDYIDKNAVGVASRKISESSIQHGQEWADKSLSRYGIITTQAQYTNTKPFYLPSEQKMISMYKERIQSEIRGLTSYQSTLIKREITAGFKNGETVTQIANRLGKITEMSKSKAITIARTETLAAGNAAATERYKTMGIERVEWIAALDDAVCPECEDLHGQMFDIGDTPDLPVHPNCRCTTIPVITLEE